MLVSNFKIFKPKMNAVSLSEKRVFFKVMNQKFRSLSCNSCELP